MLKLKLNPFGKSSIATVGSTVMNGGVIDLFLFSIMTRKPSNDRNIPQRHGELVGNDTGDTSIAVEKWVDPDEVIVKSCKETTGFVNICSHNVGHAIREVVGERIKFIVDFGSATGNVM